LPPRVLVVEDNLVNLELVTAVLAQAGCHVLSLTSAEGVVHLAATERPDLILMDLQLPGMTGYEAIRRLKADPATAAIPVVALTAQAMRGTRPGRSRPGAMRTWRSRWTPASSGPSCAECYPEASCHRHRLRGSDGVRNHRASSPEV